MPTIKSFLEYSQNVTKRKINMADIAKALNTSRSNITHKAKRDTELKLSELESITKYLQIENPAKFLNGILKMDGRLANTPDDIVVPINYDVIDIDYYPTVFGSCGSGSFVFSEEKEVLQVPCRLIQNFSGFKKYSIINAIGDSMAPYILDHDKLIIEHYNGGQISDNRIYIFRFLDNIFVKRLVLNLDQLMVISDNTNYPTRTIEHKNFEHLQIIGRIVGILREEL